ncbi:hypothetical protein G6F57_014671 [Rhizopus arrhizus]|nr:hypothetical protein G6F57_014671 [Rhizopus arrhizus]
MVMQMRGALGQHDVHAVVAGDQRNQHGGGHGRAFAAWIAQVVVTRKLQRPGGRLAERAPQGIRGQQAGGHGRQGLVGHHPRLRRGVETGTCERPSGPRGIRGIRHSALQKEKGTLAGAFLTRKPVPDGNAEWRGRPTLVGPCADKRSSRRGLLADQLFLDTRRLARAVAQVVQLGAAHVAAALDFDAGDLRRVQLERTFHGFTRRNLAHGERGVQAAVALGDNNAFESLHALASAFNDVHAHDDGVTRSKFRLGLAAGQTGNFFLFQDSDKVH